MSKTFEITQQHLKLFKRTYIEKDEYSIYGTAFGNSDVYGDILEILEIEMLGDDGFDPRYSSKQRKFAEELFSEMPMALQVCMSAGCFETGLYTHRCESGFGPYWKRS